MVRFDEVEHRYYDGDKELISVTTLLRKHGLAPDYSAAPVEILNRKAERGTLIHQEIEDYIKLGVVGFTTELENFINYIKENNIEIIASEEIVYNDIVAGKYDLLCKRGDDIIRVDYKTTYRVHKQDVSWQLSCYDELDSKYKANKLEVWHFDSDGKMTIVPIDFVNNDIVKELFDRERRGEVSEHLPSIEIDDESLAVIEEATHIIERAKKESDEAKMRMDSINKAIIAAMVENGVKSYENDFIKITLVAPYEKQSIDTTRLKKDMPEVATKYTKISQVAASLKIALKENNND